MIRPKAISLMSFSRESIALSRIAGALLRGIGWLKVVVLVFGVAAALVAGTGVVAAQGGPPAEKFVDLAVEVIVPDGISSPFNHYFLVTVANKGTVDARDVAVRITISEINVAGMLQVTDLEENAPTLIPGLPEGIFATDSANTSTGVWRLNRLVAQQAYTASFSHVLDAYGIRTYDAEISAAEGFESKARLGNNASRAYQAFSRSGARPPVGWRGLTVSVDNRFPATDGTGVVNLTVVATRPLRVNEYTYSRDVTVAVNLPTGLTPGTPTFDPSNRSMAYDATTGVFAVGHMYGELNSEYKMTLPVTVSNGAVLEEQCLTAEISGLPDGLRPLFLVTGVAFDDPTDNVARLCLGTSPVSVYTHGAIDIWTMYPCVGNTNEPCDSTDDVRVRGVDHAVSPARILDSGTVVVHVRDKPGRVFDDHEDSVTDAATVSWQTSTLFEGRQYLGTIQGPRIRGSQQPFVDVRDQWTEWNRTFTATGLGGGEPLGNVSERWVGTGIGKAIMTSENSWTASYSDPVTSRERPFLTMLEFEKLGTYVLDHKLEATHATHVDAQGEARVYSGTNRTIFHVGPIAELEVRDYGASPDAGSNEVAFTVMALNHGLDPSVASKVDIALPDGATLVRAVPSSGAYDPESGVWTVGPLMSREFRLVRSLPEGETLTLVVTGVTSDDAAAQATATISNDNTGNPYQVCINSTGATVDAASESGCTTASGSWHEGMVYDPVGSNDEVKLTAKDGAGATLPEVSARGLGPTVIVVEWTELSSLYGAEVTHYAIEWSPNGTDTWTEFSNSVTAASYYDVGLASGTTRYYRVTVVNAKEQKSPTFGVADATTAAGPSGPTGVRATAVDETSILVEWSALAQVDGSDVTHYEVEVSNDGVTAWTQLVASETGTSYTHMNLNAGDTRHYRVYAHTGDGKKSDASGTASATTRTVATLIIATGVRATAVDETSILVEWSALAQVDGSDVTHYEVEVSNDGVTAWTQLVASETGTSYTHMNLNAGDTRHYRVYAHTGDGKKSDASGTASATTRTVATLIIATGVRATAVDETSILVEWSALAQVDGSDVTHYEVEVSNDGVTAWTQLVASETGTSYTHMNLNAGDTRHYRVYAHTGDGKKSDASGTASATTRTVATLIIATGVRATAVDETSILVEWSALAQVDGSDVTHYEVEVSNDGVTAWTQLVASETGTSYTHMNLNAGDTRHYRVYAHTGDGKKSDASGTASATTRTVATLKASAGKPDAPVLDATANGRTEIVLDWQKPIENGSRITAYTLEAADRYSGPWTDTGATLDGNAVSWTHTGLTGATTKYYRIKAINGVGHSPWSEPASATTLAPGAAGPPTNVHAKPDGDSAIDVTWVAPLDDGGKPITSYHLQWSADGVSGWRDAGSTSDVVNWTFKDTGMTFGTTRYYRVAARNRQGLGAWSEPPYASATTLAGVPGVPLLTARATDANAIKLTWTVPSDSGSTIIRYELEWSPDGNTNSWNTLTNPGALETAYDHFGLNPGTERHYRIRAVSGATPGEGSWSSVRSAKTPPALPAAPDLRAAANGENAIELSWDPPTDNGGAAISGYELQVSSDGGANYSLLASPSALARSYTHSGLKPGDERLYQLRARNSAGWGPVSQSVYAFTVTGVPAAPGLTVRASGSTEIKLTWTKSDGNGSEINRYELDVSNDGNDWSTLSDSISDNDSEYVHSGLSGGTTKYYRIRAWNGNGAGQWSITRSAQTDSGGPEAPVLTAMPVSERQIDLSWTEPADNGSSITGYWVERSVSSDGPWERLTSNRSMTYSDTDLYRGTKRYYRVAATNRVGTGPYSNLESATSIGAPATAPESPTLLRLSNVGRNQVTIAWDAPDNDGGAPVSGYEYEVAPPCQDQPAVNCGFTGNDIKTATGSSARISGLSTGGAYYFRVRAVNPIGTGGLVPGDPGRSASFDGRSGIR